MVNGKDTYIMVSVIMITYGHERYICEAIEGVLMQSCNFNIELIIANDHSADNTDEVVRKYLSENKIPSNFTIKYKKHELNKGIQANFIWAMQQVFGDYIALCEGDDYWTDPLKLQKQVAFLEANEDYSFSFHKIIELNSTAKVVTLNNPEEEKTYTINDLAKQNMIATTSVVFRKNFTLFPSWFEYSPMGDYPLHLLNARFGKIKYFPEEMAAYRIGAGIWSSMNEVENIVNTMFGLRLLINEFKDEKEVKNNLANQYSHFSTVLMRSLKNKNILEENIKNYRFLESIISFRNLVKIIILKFYKKLRLEFILGKRSVNSNDH